MVNTLRRIRSIAEVDIILLDELKYKVKNYSDKLLKQVNLYENARDVRKLNDLVDRLGSAR